MRHPFFKACTARRQLAAALEVHHLQQAMLRQVQASTRSVRHSIAETKDLIANSREHVRRVEAAVRRSLELADAESMTGGVIRYDQTATNATDSAD